MESPIDVVRRFCAAWSDNVSTVELAAFFTDDAVYQNVPLAPITGRDAIANNIASFIRPVLQSGFVTNRDCSTGTARHRGN